MVSAAASRFGRVDIFLVTNAGGPPAGASGDADDAAWRGAVDLTLLSFVRLCRAVIPAMRHARWGRIVHLASVTVREPLDRMGSVELAAGSGGGLLEDPGARAGPGRDHIQRRLPGAHGHHSASRTGRGTGPDAGNRRREILAAWKREIPAGRLGRPEEIADLAAFLCSERAAFSTAP